MKLLLLLTVIIMSGCSSLPQYDKSEIEREKNILTVSSLMETPAAMCEFGW